VGGNAGAGNTSGSSGTGVTTGSGNRRGTAATAQGSDAAALSGPPTTGDAAIDAQDRALDRKIKSICKGC
jgi:hypothetical protein